VQTGATTDVIGARAVAEQFAGRARAARPAYIDGAAGLVWMQGGQTRVVFDFTIVDGKIAEIEILADPARLSDLEITLG
jgi:RNA polymerase sigma-70 factor (ECF subfamily)